MKVVAFNGSARKDGNTAILIKWALGELEADGIETEMVQLAGTGIHGCTACGRCFENKDRRCVVTDDILNDCLDKMLDADGIILGSPTYFADVSTEMKALIDRAGFVARANDDMFRRKVGAAFDTMNHFFTISQMIIPGSRYWNMGFGLKKGDVETDEEGLETMQTLGRNMAWLIKKINA